MREWGRADTARFVRVPTADDDKYSRGVVTLRTGSPAYPGAAVLGVEGAWRAGAGFVRFLGDAAVAAAVLARRPETVIGGEAARTGAWVIGSGTDSAARTPAEEEALTGILTATATVVVDAGALGLAAGATAPRVLTPHAREFARLRERLGLGPVVAAERAAEAAAETARVLNAVILLKGATTFVASPEGPVHAVAEAPTWLATAGTGDVLAGILGALIAANPGAPLGEVAAAGAFLHGEAARIASGTIDGGKGHPIVALDVAQALPAAIGGLLS